MNTLHQLQFWDDRMNRYVPSAEPANAEHARTVAKGRSWRICDAARPLKPTAYRTPRRALRSVEDIKSDYLQYARTANLDSITMYSSCRPPVYAGNVRYITPAEQFAVETSDIDPLTE
jgi:hypothetical protein